MANNRATNHWATKVFPVRGSGRNRERIGSRVERIEKFLKDPTLVYQAARPPVLSKLAKQLAGLS